ncbi:MAG: hypothetical protein PVH28_04005 [Desulfobacterales bacterium]|jgi:dihydroxyacetone kinase
MEPLKLGQTVEEAKASIRDYAEMGFGISKRAIFQAFKSGSTSLEERSFGT